MFVTVHSLVIKPVKDSQTLRMPIHQLKLILVWNLFFLAKSDNLNVYFMKTASLDSYLLRYRFMELSAFSVQKKIRYLDV